MIIRISQVVTTEIEVAANDPDQAISMVKGQHGDIVDRQYSEPVFEVIKLEE